MKWIVGIVALSCVATSSAAMPARWTLEPATFGVERLHSVWTSSGLASRTAMRIGAGAAFDLGRGLSLGANLGCAAGTTDFGLLSGPSARLVRADWTMEVRARAPLDLGAWSVQAALGGGGLRTTYRPDAIVLDTSGGALLVDLAPVHAWTKHVAAEVLHGRGRTALVLRTGWRWYGLDVATPSGIERRDVRDLQCSLGVRVRGR